MSFPFRPKTDTIQSDLWQRPFRGPVVLAGEADEFFPVCGCVGQAAVKPSINHQIGRSGYDRAQRVPTAFDPRCGCVKCHNSPDIVNFFSR